MATQERLAALGADAWVESSSLLLPLATAGVVLICLLPFMLVACCTKCCRSMLSMWYNALCFLFCRCCGLWDLRRRRKRSDRRVKEDADYFDEDDDQS